MSPRPMSPRLKPVSPRKSLEQLIEDTISGEDKVNIPTITEMIKQKRDELLSLLKLKKQQECDPAKGINCGDNKYCDIDKNICVSPEEALYKQKKGLVEVDIFNQQNIIGSRQSIELLNSMKDEDIVFDDFEYAGAEETKEQPVEIPVIKTKSTTKRRKNAKIMCDVCTFVNDPGSNYCDVCGSNLQEIETPYNLNIDENLEIDNIDDSLGEGIEITNIENIQNILNEIQTKEDISLNGIDTAKRKVLSCLGLLA